MKNMEIMIAEIFNENSCQYSCQYFVFFLFNRIKIYCNIYAFFQLISMLHCIIRIIICNYITENLNKS